MPADRDPRDVPDGSLEQLRQDVARALDRPAEAIGDSDDLLDLGLDSIRLMSLLQAWSTPGSELDLIEFVDDPRLVAWASRVDAAGGAA